MTDACALCGLPVVLGSIAPTGELLHHGGELSQIIGWTHFGEECRPIRTSCYRAWMVHEMRPPANTCDDDHDPCDGWQPCLRCGGPSLCAHDVCDGCLEVIAGEG